MPHSTLIDVLDGIAARPRADLLQCRERGSVRVLSSGEVVAAVRSLAAFLIDFGVAPGDRVAVLSENRPEWTIADLAIQASGAVNVPLHTTLAPDLLAYVLRDSGAVAAVAGRPEHLSRLARAALEIGRPLRVIVCDPPGARSAAGGGLETAALAEARAHGDGCLGRTPRLVEDRMRAVRPADLASVIYTSGTTGEPKGVMLTHANFCANVDACLAIIPFTADDVAMSLLPLSHIFERTLVYMYLAAGAQVVYVDAPERALPQMVEVRPTVFATVPRVLEKVHDRIRDTVRSSSSLRRALFDGALDAGRERLRCRLEGRRLGAGLALRSRIADRLVFAAVHARLGGRIRFVISGGAPLPREVGEFFLAAGITVLEGYGLTEASPVVSVNTPERLKPGTVGPPLPGVGVTIAGDGEILVRGPNVMAGYFGDEPASRAAFRDGALATGDVGRLDGDGFLVITDRKKDILITSGGKNVAPQPIENAIRASRYIANVVLVGDRRKYLTALVVPDFEALAERSRELEGLDPALIVARAEVVELIGREIESATLHLPNHEKVRRFTLLERDFSMEAGELTPTHKVRRGAIQEKYRRDIEAMYGG